MGFVVRAPEPPWRYPGDMQDNGSATLAPESEGDGGLSIPTVAAQLGISKDAVRRRLRSGQLAGHQIVTRHGPTWCVHPGDPPPSHQGSATPAVESAHGGATVAPGVPGPDLAALVALVDRLQSENQQLAATAAVWQERARVLGDQLALAAPQEAQPAPEATPVAPKTDLHRLARLWPAALGLVAVVLVIALLTWPR